MLFRALFLAILGGSPGRTLGVEEKARNPGNWKNKQFLTDFVLKNAISSTFSGYPRGEPRKDPRSRGEGQEP